MSTRDVTRVGLSFSIFCGASQCKLAITGEVSYLEVAQKARKELPPVVLQAEMVSFKWMRRRGCNVSTSV